MANHWKDRIKKGIGEDGSSTDEEATLMDKDLGEPLAAEGEEFPSIAEDRAKGLPYKLIVLIVALAVLAAVIVKGPGGSVLQPRLESVELVGKDKALFARPGETVEIDYGEPLTFGKVQFKGMFKLLPLRDIAVDVEGVGAEDDLRLEDLTGELRPEDQIDYTIQVRRGGNIIDQFSLRLLMTDEDWLKRGEALAEPERRLVCYQNALQVNQDKVKALRKLAVAYGEAKNFRKQLGTYQRLVTADEGDASKYHYHIGLIWKNSKEYEKARFHLTEAAKLDPNNYLVHQQLKKVAEKRSDWKSVVTQLKTMVKLRPGKTDLQIELAKAYQKTGNAKEAIRYYETAAKKKPKDVNLLLNLALLYEKDKKYSEAITYYQKASKIDSSNATLFNNMGVLLDKADKPKEAAKAYRTAAKLQTKDPVIILNLADAYMRGKQWQEATTTYKKVVAIKPKDPEAHERLLQLYKKTGDHSRAVSEYEQLIRLRPKDASLHVGLGATYEALKQHDNAMKHYEEALKLSPENKEARERLIKLSIAEIRMKKER
jgi:tetratricopeptide (TPR) repeat protein